MLAWLYTLLPEADRITPFSRVPTLSPLVDLLTTSTPLAPTSIVPVPKTLPIELIDITPLTRILPLLVTVEPLAARKPSASPPFTPELLTVSVVLASSVTFMGTW